MNDKRESQTVFEKTAACLKSLAHPLRLEIVDTLRSGPLCVSEIEEIVGTTQSNLSQHLSLLKNKGVVEARREKNQIYYSVENWRIFQLVDTARNIFCQE